MRRTLFVLVMLGCSQSSQEDLERRKPKVDAALAEPPPSTGDPATAGVVSCYSTGAPTNTCTAPAYCCFTNYTADHNGYCTSTAACEWGTILCDGPEDCANGERCCATASADPVEGITGYSVACKASCDGPKLDHELCHPSATNTCASGSCVTAYGNANDLPRTLYVCL